MYKRGPAKLKVRKGNRKFTYCHYRNEENEIVLEAGEGTSLLTLFDLPFYFFHEYVSHAYAVWDDSRWRFSESYLLRAAAKYMDLRFQRENRPRRPFLGMNFDALRAESSAPFNDFSKADTCFAEMYGEAGPCFVKFLLEWAAAPGGEAEIKERELALSGFHALVRDPEELRAVFGPDEPGEMYERTYQRLCGFVQRKLNI